MIIENLRKWGSAGGGGGGVIKKNHKKSVINKYSLIQELFLSGLVKFVIIYLNSTKHALKTLFFFKIDFWTQKSWSERKLFESVHKNAHIWV